MALRLDTVAEWLEAVKAGDGPDILCADALRELERACEKFPMFPDTFTVSGLDRVRRTLATARVENDEDGGERATCATALQEEYSEMAEAVMTGDGHAARKGIVRCIAMLLRLYIHLPHYCETEQKERAKEVSHGG